MTDFPTYPEHLSPDFLTRVIAEQHPGTVVGAVQVLGAEGFGDTHVSTAARVRLEVRYGANPRSLPNRIFVKMPKTNDWPSRGVALPDGARQRPPRTPLFENEVNFYRHEAMNPEVAAAPTLGAIFDPPSGRFVLLLEDLAHGGAAFPSQYDTATWDHSEGLLAALARIHAAYWNSPRFPSDLGWLQSTAEGPVAACLHGPVQTSVRDELDKLKFKRELLGRIGLTPEALFADLGRLQRHQQRGVQTLIHGDAHFGNTYWMADGSVGFFDWQLAARGSALQDVSYLIVTAHSIDERRRRERDLLRIYREHLAAHGVTPLPSADEIWLEYRRAMHWCVAIGWMPCPVEAYGWELVVIANNRTTAAYEDLETAQALREVPA